jgi:hypothetical protein
MKPKITHGTAKDLANISDGFSSSGASMYTRREAHPDNVRMGRMHRNPKLRATDIRCNEIELERMQKALAVERKPERRSKLLRNIDAKSNWVAKLRAERDVETLPGEYDIIKWDDIS